MDCPMIRTSSSTKSQPSIPTLSLFSIPASLSHCLGPIKSKLSSKCGGLVTKAVGPLRTCCSAKSAPLVPYHSALDTPFKTPGRSIAVVEFVPVKASSSHRNQ